MQKLATFFLALVVTLLAATALATATSGFRCDFVRVAARHVPACDPAPRVESPLLSMARRGVNGS